jgi:uncharacterized glyoxalase superfamily protein PhnB
MTALKPIFILYVSSQEKSREFYTSVLGTLPVLDVPGMTEFNLSEQAVLGLMPESGIVRILGETVPDPKKGNGIPRCELYIYVDDPSLYYERAIHAGAIKISSAQQRNWGDIVAYCADPDGHIIAFALKGSK